MKKKKGNVSFYFSFAPFTFSGEHSAIGQPMVQVLYTVEKYEGKGGFGEGKWKTRERLTFPYYLSLAALLTSFLRGLLNKAIPFAGDL